MLAEHPDIEARLRQEVLEKVGPFNRPTYANMREMKFMRAFLNGTLFSLGEFKSVLIPRDVQRF